ncbi:MAG: ATP-binding protein [Eubacteriaceae bacterium]|jgi:serine/threonine-protein kinase RsbT
MSYNLTFDVESGDFDTAGQASRKIKKQLQSLGISSKIIRHIAIAGYEGEMNLAIHSDGGQIILEADPDKVVLRLEDRGPGIPDVNLAMTEGWSTASDQVREMGFGAGMGLPNMRNNSDSFEIHSKPGEGTKIKMCFNL